MKSDRKPYVEIFTDGAARGNPDGPGGYGAVIKYTDSRGELHTKELSGGFPKTTNNRMEMTAAIEALKALNRPCRVDLYSDSSYLVRAFNDGWIENWKKKDWKKSDGKKVLNTDLWMELLKETEKHEITWKWVKGHSGQPENERCDSLATAAADAMRK